MLASDLDGTLIPPGRDRPLLEEVRRFREAAAARGLELAYVTGRDFELALRGIESVGLPLPDTLVCDVGTSVHVRALRGNAYVLDEDYRRQVRAALGGADREALVARVGTPEGLTLQEPHKQSEFKVSYYVDPGRVAELRPMVEARLSDLGPPPKVVWSHDPYSGRMLLDLLPRGIAKHTALEHLRVIRGSPHTDILYAGDSGNDLDAFLSGHPAVIVANAPDTLKREVRERADTRSLTGRLYFARAPFAAGVMEGARHFGIFS